MADRNMCPRSTAAFWLKGDTHTEYTWHGIRMEYMWKVTHGMAYTWNTYGPMAYTWNTHGIHMTYTWNAHEIQMLNTWHTQRAYTCNTHGNLLPLIRTPLRNKKPPLGGTNIFYYQFRRRHDHPPHKKRFLVRSSLLIRTSP